MRSESLATARPQSIATDKFFFFFFGLRKGEIRRRVEGLQRAFPNESPGQLARRLVNADTPLSLVSGALLHLPILAPGVGLAVRLLGSAAAATAMAALHVHLMLEIALLFGPDIDDQARVPEMAAIIVASGLTAATPILLRAIGLSPLLAVPAGTVTVAAARRLTVEAAVRYYSKGRSVPMAQAYGGAQPAV